MLRIVRFSRILPSKYTIYRTGDTGTEKGSYSSLKSTPHELHLVVSFLACTDTTVKSSWTALYRFRMKPEWPELFIGEFVLSWWGEQEELNIRSFKCYSAFEPTAKLNQNVVQFPFVFSFKGKTKVVVQKLVNQHF